MRWGTLDGASPRFVHWKDTLEGILLCFVCWNDTLEGIS